jgi:putative flavoprotein involved in K+ transport
MSASDEEYPVLIIGGGAAGLATAATLSSRGIKALVLDKEDSIGKSWSRRYQCLKLHTIRRYSGLPHYPIPEHFPQYLSKDDYAAYLQQYVAALGLNVSLTERVDSVQRVTGSASSANWEVVTNSGVRRAKAVVIATGHYAEPFHPQWEGREEFKGEVIHSSQFVDGATYRGKRVLIIGLGNSAAEIATNLSFSGVASVSISVRTTPPIVTREMFGFVPVQLFGIYLMKLGMPKIIDRIGAVLRRISIGDLSKYGLGEAKWGPFTARKPAVIDSSGFIQQLKLGFIEIRPQLARLDTTHACYVDGYSEEIDVVISAVGFRTGLEKIMKIPGLLDEEGEILSGSGQRVSNSGLYFIGFDETIRGHLFEISRESKRLAIELDRYLNSS